MAAPGCRQKLQPLRRETPVSADSRVAAFSLFARPEGDDDTLGLAAPQRAESHHTGAREPDSRRTHVSPFVTRQRPSWLLVVWGAAIWVVLVGLRLMLEGE
jgi:hypothetical protein